VKNKSQSKSSAIANLEKELRGVVKKIAALDQIEDDSVKQLLESPAFGILPFFKMFEILRKYYNIEGNINSLASDSKLIGGIKFDHEEIQNKKNAVVA